MFTKEEKILIFASLFHDIGKFRQRCMPYNQSHPVLSAKFIDEFMDNFKDVFPADENENFADIERIKLLVENHHGSNPDELLPIIRSADHLSASERVEKELINDISNIQRIDWGHHYLCSLFSKINLNSNTEVDLRYYKHQPLTKENYKVLIPNLSKEESQIEAYKYKESDWNKFTEDFKTVMNFYKNEDDFNTLINLLLLILEKYIWCVPDFTGSSETDISLFNHLKDVCGLSLAIYKSKKDFPKESKLNIIVGDIPGIQKYIFDLNNKKAAKMLRGRSLFVQVLSRNFASLFLDNFGLTECNLVMLAGGKFYIIIPNVKNFEEIYLKTKSQIEKYLFENFSLDLQFACGHTDFDYKKLKSNEITFGKIIEEVEFNLLTGKNKYFKDALIPENNFPESAYVLNKSYIKPDDSGESDSIKCAISEKPIEENRKKIIHDADSHLTVDKQIYHEFEVGRGILKNNIIIQFENDNYSIKDIKNIRNFTSKEHNKKILLNPVLEELLKHDDNKIDFLRNTTFLEAANFCSLENDGTVMDLETMSEKNQGAEFLTLIKGDVDNLGLIMAFGLDRDKDSLTAISRTTTLSNHLKYFFSFFLNGFLKENDNIETDNLCYTIFAGGDDMMLICPQSRALNLTKQWNDAFKDFVCNNPEVHITYSITHFKHNTPVRIVAEFAEENQKVAKKKLLTEDVCEKLNNPECFFEKNDKSTTRIFETNIKNTEVEKLLNNADKLTRWYETDKISMGIIRNMLNLSEIIKEWRLYNDTSKLIWHPHLTYLINRNLKDKHGNYKSEEIGEFFESVLSISKNTEELELEKILYPAICGVIYKLRK